MNPYLRGIIGSIIITKMASNAARAEVNRPAPRSRTPVQQQSGTDWWMVCFFLTVLFGAAFLVWMNDPFHLGWG